MRFRYALLSSCTFALGWLGCRDGTTTSAHDDAEAPSSPALGHAPDVRIDPFDPDAAIGARVDALFGSSCVGGPETACHGSAAAGLTLRLGERGDLVEVPSTERPEMVRVRPFQPESSYLFLKVRGDGGIEGGRMPLDAPEDPRIADVVRSWIEAGAPNP